jgi:ParB family chromosome partitioning protein
MRPARSGDKPDLDVQSYGTRPRQTPQSALVSKTVPTDRLHSSWLRPRKPYDERAIRTLAALVRTSGWQHPILVRPHPVIARNYEIVVGELPFQAARFAGLEHLTVVVCSLSDIRALECVLLEDVRRPDLTPFEVAVGYGQLIRTFKYSLAELAELVGKSERQVVRNLLLLDSPLDSSLDSPGAARKAPGGREVRPDLVRPSAGAADAPSLDVKAPAGSSGDPERPSLNTELAALERHLSGAIGLEVEMTTKGRQGAVQISFANIEQLECIARHLSSFDVHAEPEPTCPGLAA